MRALTILGHEMEIHVCGAPQGTSGEMSICSDLKDCEGLEVDKYHGLRVRGRYGEDLGFCEW